MFYKAEAKLADIAWQTLLFVSEWLTVVKEAEKWSFKSKIWKPKISFFVIKKP